MVITEIRRAGRDDFPAIARLIAEQNETPESQCIHSGEGYESILQTMVKWYQVSEICFAIAVGEDHLVGLLGSEFDEDLGRGWLWGPFVVAQDWIGSATTRGVRRSALLEKLLVLLPPTVRRLDFFLNIANQRAIDFYLDHGFCDPRLSHVYVAPRPAAPFVLVEPCPPLALEQAKSFCTLHDIIFPRTYYTGRDILDQRDDGHQLFICGQGDELLGYVHAIVDERSAGYIDFLGVRADVRGRGLGGRLLLSALHWLFDVKRVPEVGLTVSDDQVNARSLYERAGFRIRYTGLSAHKEW